jgi:hypothetical protein
MNFRSRAAIVASLLASLFSFVGAADAEPGPVIVGIVLREVGRTFAIIQESPGAKPGFYEVGARVGDSVVTEILVDRVTLDAAGQRTQLRLSASVSGARGGSAPGGPPAVTGDSPAGRRGNGPMGAGPDVRLSPYGRIETVVAPAGLTTGSANTAPGGSSSDLGGGVGQAGGVGSSEGSQNGVTAGVTITGRLHDGRSLTASEFSTSALRDLLFAMTYSSITDLHQQRLELYAPDGSLYQRLTGAIALRTQTLVPVGGTWITEHTLYGGWRVDIFVDRETSPIVSQSFTLDP